MCVCLFAGEWEESKSEAVPGGAQLPLHGNAPQFVHSHQTLGFNEASAEMQQSHQV